MKEPVRFLSVCSGIEAASLAFGPLGWQAAGFAETAKFPSETLAAHYGSNMPGEPLSRNGVPNFGDFTTLPTGPDSPLGRVDVLAGGTPCQSFSIAGARLSLADARGNLTLAYTVLAHELARYHGLRNALWENVPGILSAKDNAFGCFLGGLVGHDAAIPAPGGKRWPGAGMVCGPRARAAWRILDAQYFGLAQRRARLFVVADFGNGADPAAVLFEPQSLQWNHPPRRKKRKDIAGTLGARTGGGGGLGTDFDLDGGLVAAFGGGNCAGPIEQAATLTAKGQRCDFEVETFVAYRTSPNAGVFETGNLTSALTTGSDPTGHVIAGVRDMLQGAADAQDGAAGDDGMIYTVRRLTPLECGRLQGFPDGYTAIARGKKCAEACPDGPQYKALGNSWPVPVVAWIGARIEAALP